MFVFWLNNLGMGAGGVLIATSGGFGIGGSASGQLVVDLGAAGGVAIGGVPSVSYVPDIDILAFYADAAAGTALLGDKPWLATSVLRGN